jgi:hypothetical protein
MARTVTLRFMTEHEQALRAARSYNRNRDLQPKMAERLARAESWLQSYLLRAGQEAIRLGGYEIALRDGQIEVTTAPPDGWEQSEIEWKVEDVR